jgi:DNA-directed RNA polymerase specialized sigma subunit
MIVRSVAFDPTQKSLDIEIWRRWKNSKSPQDLEILLKRMDSIIHRVVVGQRGTLPDQFLELQAKKYALQAFESFDPGRGVALSTHLTNVLKQLSRLNMTYKQSARIPEHQQRKVSEFLVAKDELQELHGRPATSDELSDYLKWNQKEIHRLELATKAELTDVKPIGHEEAAGFRNIQEDIDPMIAFFYQELDPIDKLIFEYTTGYGGKPVLNNNQLARKVKLSYSQLSYRKRLLINKMKTRLGH